MNKHFDIKYFMRGGFMAKKITALPSVLIMDDGSEKELKFCSPEERENWNNKIRRRVSDAIRELYADNPTGWNEFATRMAS